MTISSYIKTLLGLKPDTDDNVVKRGGGKEPSMFISLAENLIIALMAH